MSAQACRVDTSNTATNWRVRDRTRVRTDKLPNPCIACGADRVNDSYPYKSKLCSDCANDRGYGLPQIPRTVPSAPLAVVIEDIIAREERLEPFSRFKPADKNHKPSTNRGWVGAVGVEARRGGVCARAGISTKSLQEWRKGARKTIPWDTADKVLQRLGLFWDEVWTPENTPAGEYAALREALG